jgi:hypothetical protein
MKVNTAVCFVAAGAGLVLLIPEDVGKRSRTLAIALGALVLTVGALTLSQYLFGWQLGIDELLLADDPNAVATSHPGRMAFPAALSFVVGGFALLALGARPSVGALAYQAPALFVHLLASLALVGYATDVSALYRVEPYTSMAMHTAAVFWLWSLAVVIARPHDGLMTVIASDTIGGLMARRLLPAVPVALVVFCVLALAGADRGWFDERFALIATVALGMVFTAILICWQAYVIHHIDLSRRQARATIVAINEDLERRVEVRTRELREALDQVKQLHGLLPICSWCKKVRDDQNLWQSVEEYVAEHTDAEFSHGICPDCYAKAEREALASSSLAQRDALPPLVSDD